MIKILVKNLKQVTAGVNLKQVQIKEQMNIIKEDLKQEIIEEVNN